MIEKAVDNSRDIVNRVLEGQSVDGRVAVGPLAAHYCAHLAGVSLRDYTLDPRVLADCIVRYYERFRPDAIWISADTWVTAQAMGAAVAFPDPQQPMAGAGRPYVQSSADIDRIPPPDPQSQGRCPIMLEAARRVRETLGGNVFIVACFDQYPFSLACALMGIEEVMIQLMHDRSMIESLMERCSEYAISYATALAEAGADMLSGGDSPAGLIGARQYREVALPYEKRVISALQSRLSQPISLHICGNATPILADMASSSADVLELDHLVDVATACRTLGPEIAIWGNLDPVGLLTQGRPDDVRNAARRLMQTVAKYQHRRFVVSSGCTLAVETPSENLDALIETARGFHFE